MATARYIQPEDVPALNITITSSGVASPNQTCIIANGQQVIFTNTSGSSVNIVFQLDAQDPTVAVFNNVNGLSPTAPNNTNSQTPLTSNRTVNYSIVIGTNTFGPYAIQVGAGPMYISVSYNSALNKGDVTPDTAVVPFRGTVEMISTDYQYRITWNASNGNPFPGLTDIYTYSNPLTKVYSDTLPVGPYGYTVTKTGMIADGTGHGGGTVKVGSS